MRPSIRVLSRSENGYEIRFQKAQHDAILAALMYMRTSNRTEEMLEIQIGFSLGAIAQIEEKIRDRSADAPIPLSAQELHVIYCATLTTIDEFITEEDFYIYTGFFKDNFRQLGRSIAKIGGDTKH